jgi:hypothetical protein
LDYGLCLLEDASTGAGSSGQVSRPDHYFGRST